MWQQRATSDSEPPRTPRPWQQHSAQVQHCACETAAMPSSRYGECFESDHYLVLARTKQQVLSGQLQSKDLQTPTELSVRLTTIAPSSNVLHVTVALNVIWVQAAHSDHRYLQKAIEHPLAEVQANSAAVVRARRQNDEWGVLAAVDHQFALGGHARTTWLWASQLKLARAHRKYSRKSTMDSDWMTALALGWYVPLASGDSTKSARFASQSSRAMTSYHSRVRPPARARSACERGRSCVPTAAERRGWHLLVSGVVPTVATYQLLDT
jgi:hypothetical protein